MRWFFSCVALLVVLAGGLGTAAAAISDRRNELGLHLGAELIPDGSTGTKGGSLAVKTSASEVFQISYGRRLKSFSRTELWLDVPALAGPSHSIDGGPALPTSVATFYVTPSVRLVFGRDRAIRPWVSAGGGYSLYETSDRLRSGAKNPTIHTSTGAAQFGGGVDVKTPVHFVVPIGLRGEVRDFYTPDAPVTSPALRGGQNNIAVSGGLLLRF